MILTTFAEQWKKELKSKIFLYSIIVGLAVYILLHLFPGIENNLYWASDDATYLIDMHNAINGNQKLGIASRFGWSHPGPLNYYFMVPFYWFGNESGQSLILGTALLNLLILAGMVAIIQRLCGVSAAAYCLLIFSAYYVFYLTPSGLLLTIIRYSTILPWCITLVLGVATIIRGFKWIPFMTLSSCYIMQAHVGFWLPVVGVVFFSIVASIIIAKPKLKDFLWFVVAALLLVFLWIPPFSESENLVKIYHFFLRPQDQHSLFEATTYFLSLLSKPLLIPDDYYGLQIFTGFTLNTLTIISMIFSYIKSKKFTFALSSLLIITNIICIFSLVHYEGPILIHSILWMTSLTPLMVITISLTFLKEEHLIRLKKLFLLGILIIFFAGSAELKTSLAQSQTSNVEIEFLTNKVKNFLILHYINNKEPPLIVIDLPCWPHAFGVLAQLFKSNYSFYIEKWYSFIFSNHIPIKEDYEGKQIVFASSSKPIPKNSQLIYRLDPVINCFGNKDSINIYAVGYN